MPNKFSIFDSVEGFISQIPCDVSGNLQFRIDLHRLLAKDKSAQQVFWQMCKQDLQILFDTSFWTLDPRKPWGMQNQPFILRPKQIPAVHTIDRCIKEGHDVGINKTRDEGASEIVAKIFSAWCMLYERVSFILGSDKKDDVDNIGNDYTLFAKVDNVFENLPSWMGFKFEKDGGCIKRKDMLLRIGLTNSAIIGETTNENFSAGSRATAMALDEIGRIRKSVAESIEGTVHAVTNCVIYTSTHWLGQNHTFNICLNKETTEVIELLWYDCPGKKDGLYRSPKTGIVVIEDIEYYRKLVPEVFDEIETGQEFGRDHLERLFPTLSEDAQERLKKIEFVADGNKDKIITCRSPWHDYKEKQSKGNKRDFYCNTWATPLGSADSVFDPVTLYEIKERFIRPPTFEGEIVFELNDEDSIVNTKFVQNFGQRRLKWWGPLINGRPDQRHNYIVGADPSQGLGSSNSVAYIYDVNTHELLGEWCCANTKPDPFADQCVAIAEWCGGVESAFLIWERNGGHGTNFTDRVIYVGYYWCYQQTVEDAKTRKKKEKYGFSSNRDRKAALFGEFDIALAYGLEGNIKYVAAIIYSEDLVDELFDYMFTGEGNQIRTSSKADLSTGAYERHGDRGIAAALCILGTRDQQRGEYFESKKVPYGSFVYYQKLENEKQAADRRQGKKYLFNIDY